MATTPIDTTTLTMIINQCFSFAMDARVSPADQNSFLIEGKRLRGQLINLLSAQFDDTTAQFAAATASLTKVNTALSNSATALANVAATLNGITTLIGNLDKLLTVATSFV
jgi:hypothetical protein